MYNYPSRSEKRQQRFYSAAEKGWNYLTGQILYLSEIKKLEKDGFVMVDMQIFDHKRKLYSCTVSWVNAYKKGIPTAVLNYIYHVIEAYPKSLVNSFAQELFVISERVNAKKH